MELLDVMECYRARDVMRSAVWTLRPGDRLVDAVRLFLAEQIQAVPVVDQDGRCVGLLSATDLLRSRRMADPVPGAFETEELVQDLMTQDLVSVREDEELSKIIRYMVDAHVHRVVVLDEMRRVRGLATMTDVLSAMLRAEQASLQTAGRQP